jgi:cell division cycle 20-like protein 1 (cofactor of APC complex)
VCSPVLGIRTALEQLESRSISFDIITFPRHQTHTMVTVMTQSDDLSNSAPSNTNTHDASTSHISDLAVATPPRSATPPPATEKRKSENKPNEDRSRSDRAGGPDIIDPTVLSKALKEYEDAGRHRDITPGGSPSRKRQRVFHGDR